MARTGTGRPMKNESAWHTILSGNSNMICPARCFPVRTRVVPSQKTNFTDDLELCLKHGETALPMNMYDG